MIKFSESSQSYAGVLSFLHQMVEPLLRSASIPTGSMASSINIRSLAKTASTPARKAFAETLPLRMESTLSDIVAITLIRKPERQRSQI